MTISAATEDVMGESTTKRVFHGIDELKQAVGTALGTSKWHTVTQDEVNLFSDVTHDHQWIHVDEDRAAQSPFGGTVVHGYFTLALVSHLCKQVYEVSGLSMEMNYGSNSIRYPAPLKVGTSVQATVKLLSLEAAASGHKVISRITLTPDDGDRPVCVAEIITLMVE